MRRSVVEKIQKIKQQIEELKYKAEKAERESDLGAVAEIRYGQLPAAEEELEMTIQKLQDYEKDGKRLVKEKLPLKISLR